MKNSRNKKKILLIEPNYKNKYPPIGLMKISTFHRDLGDDVKFYKGNLKDFVANEIVDHCFKIKDYTTSQFLQWFVTEQVEEEESAGGVLEQLRLVKDDKSGLFMIDRELLKRAAPSEFTEAE